MRRALAALILAAGLVMAGCGGDDDDDGDGGVATEPPGTVETVPAPAETQDGTAGAVEVAADPNGALAYQQDELSADAGTVAIELTNESSVPHDVNVESQDGEDLGGTEVITSDTARAEVELSPGTYTFYCSVNGHRDAGMEGTLVVE